MKTLHQYPRHSHDFYSIGVIEKGVGGNYCRGATHEIPSGWLVTINPDEVHTGYAAGGAPLSYRMLHIDPEVFRRVAPGRVLPFFRSSALHDARCARAVACLHRELELALDPLREEELLIGTLAGLVSRYCMGAAPPRSGSVPGAIARVKDYLQSHYSEKIRLADLVRLSNLDRAYLIRSFRRALAMPPHEYLTQVRVGHAARLLAAGEPIAAAAAATGFADQSHLSRHFKRVTGTTPGQYAAGHFRSRP